MSRLGGYFTIWNQAEPIMNEFITPEDGQYRVIIEEVKYSELDKDNQPCDPTFVYTFRILEGKYKDQKFRRFTTIRDERSAGFFKGDMMKLGMPIPQNPEELPNMFLTTVGIILDVTVKTKTVNDKKYKDIYFDKMIGKQPPAVQQQPMIQQQHPQQRPPMNARAQQQGYYAPQPQRYPPQTQQTFGGGYPSDDDIPF